jgi:hypothetical protein
MEHVEETGYKPIWQPFVDESLKIAKKVDSIIGTMRPLGALLVAGGITGLYLIYQTSRETRRAAQANLLSQLLSEYASPAMQEAIRSLHRWRRAHPHDFVDSFIALLEKQDPEGDLLDGYRRHSYRYFHKVRLLCDARLIEPEWIDFVFTNEVVARFLNEVLEPMQKAHNEAIVKVDDYDKGLFVYFRNRFHPPPAPVHSASVASGTD